MRSLRSFILFSILSAAAEARPANAPPPSGFCKAVPGTPEWPSQSDWDQLSVAVGGRLLAPEPPAAVCHRGWSSFSEAECFDLNEKWADTTFHANHPTSNMWQNYNNYSCMPDAAAPCTGNGYPVYVVAASNAQDVKAAVDFAREKRIRLNIKSTGHDFLGRSVQPNSLSIWTHNLKTKDFINSFIPEGCKTAIPGLTAYVGSGNQWGELSSAGSVKRVMFVGGASTTVSVGGFISNGGHGALSAKYGLGADMVAEIELVTADGRIIKANECQNQDYFWAMRGGGGSTYGVATRFALQTIPTVPTVRSLKALKSWEDLIYMHQQWPKLAAYGISGYMNGYPGDGRFGTVSMTLPNATDRSVLKAITDPIFAGLAGSASEESRGGRDSDEEERLVVGATNATLRNTHNRRSESSEATYHWYSTWAEAEATMEDADVREKAAKFPGTGSNKIIASWLWSTEDCASPQVDAVLRRTYKDSTTQMLNDLTMGVGTWETPYMRGGGNAVNPAFRTATMRPAAEFAWKGTDLITRARKEEAALDAGAALKLVNPTGGTYANEADPQDPNWQQSFWGSNYPRLAEIKAKVDPEGVFYCRACVGSEKWVDNAGVLCKL